MPRYKVVYSVETPIRATEDVEFTHGAFTVNLGLSRQIDVAQIPAWTIAEGANWRQANAVAMEESFGPVLDALSLHRKAPAMLQDLMSVVKAETGTLRRAVVIESTRESHPVNIDGMTVREVQDALDRNGVNLPALRWLRYSYRSMPAFERFVFAWLAFENRSGTAPVVRRCPHCQENLDPFSSMDRNEAFRILQLREPDLTRAQFDELIQEWWRELRSAVLHGGRRLDSDLRQRMNVAQERFRPAVEDLVQREVGFRNAFPGARTNDGFFQMNLHHFVEFTCTPGTPEFAEAPPIPTDRQDPQPDASEAVRLLQFNESMNW